MYESPRQYQKIVDDKVSVLETYYGHKIRHGQKATCLRCQEEGVYDLKGKGFAPGGGNAIYYSTVFFEWRCRLCDYRMIA
ncbi:MAG: hypothetical protein C0615_06655 [Desulfuromonas sp.]|nr:MAG: hypothetical protein C0615_06655 [Desulfuromonas sp.]